MPPYLTFTTAEVKIKLPSIFFPNSHGWFSKKMGFTKHAKRDGSLTRNILFHIKNQSLETLHFFLKLRSF